MIKQEFIIAGCVIAFVGIAICIVGYNKIQPTKMDSAISFMEKISGEKAPADIRSSKSGGYTLLGIGFLCFLAGMGFILKSRTSVNSIQNNNQEGDD